MSAEFRDIPTVTLNDGKEMPLIGLGTSKLLDDEAIRVVRTAIDLGYRHFDTASRYGNEEALGRAFAEAIAAGDVTREELFITSKAWHDEQGAEQVQEAFHGSLRRLGLEFLDMYMIHWPWPQAGRYNETFEAMAQLQGLGRPVPGGGQLPGGDVGGPHRGHRHHPRGQSGGGACRLHAVGAGGGARASRRGHGGLVPVGEGQGSD